MSSFFSLCFYFLHIFEFLFSFYFIILCLMLFFFFYLMRIVVHALLCHLLFYIMDTIVVLLFFIIHFHVPSLWSCLPPHKIFLILSCCHCFCCYCIYSCFFADWISSPMTCLLNICSICCPLTNWFFYSIVFCFYKWGFSSNFDPFIPW